LRFTPSSEEATSDEEEADGEGGDDAAHPKKARRAEINPEIMSDQERDALRARVLAQVCIAHDLRSVVITVVMNKYTHY
jgi:hypothetical protein